MSFDPAPSAGSHLVASPAAEKFSLVATAESFVHNLFCHTAIRLPCGVVPEVAVTAVHVTPFVEVYSPSVGWIAYTFPAKSTTSAWNPAVQVLLSVNTPVPGSEYSFPSACE